MLTHFEVLLALLHEHFPDIIIAFESSLQIALGFIEIDGVTYQATNSQIDFFHGADCKVGVKHRGNITPFCVLYALHNRI